MKAKIIIVAASIVVAFTILEFILRLTWSNPYSHTSADNILKIRVHPKNIDRLLNRDLIDQKVPKVAYRTDDRHYLQPSFRFANPDFTVVFMGGSTTECIAVQEQKRFPYLVSEYLAHMGLRVNTLNAARSGSTLHDSINILLNHVVLEHPDMIVLMHVTNDIGVLQKDPTYSSRMGHDISFHDIIKYSTQLFSIHSSFFGFLRERILFNKFTPGNDYPNPGICRVDQKPFIARLKIFLATCRAFNIVPVLLTEPLAGSIKSAYTPNWGQESCQAAFNDTVREICQDAGANMIDLVSHLSIDTKNTSELESIFYDGMHVTDYGSQLYAKYIAEGICSLLQNKK